MTRERADEIDRMVFYRNIGYFTALNLTSEKMFELGRIVERLHQDLKNELSKEIAEAVCRNFESGKTEKICLDCEVEEKQGAKVKEQK